MAVEQLKTCDNIVALSRKLGVHRRLFYKWRNPLDPIRGVRWIAAAQLTRVSDSERSQSAKARAGGQGQARMCRLATH
jgi:hypothetical protein